jgi:hypothetical protein
MVRFALTMEMDTGTELKACGRMNVQRVKTPKKIKKIWCAMQPFNKITHLACRTLYEFGT